MNQYFKVFIFVGGICLCCLSTMAYANPWKMEGKVGAFFPESKRVREIFHTMPFVEVEGSYRFSYSWDTWGGVGCIFKSGESLGCGNNTNIQVIPFTLGIRKFISVRKNLEFFIGAGGLWSIYHNKDQSDYLHQNISGHCFGALFKAGLQYRLNNRISLSSSIEEVYQRFSFHRTYEEHFTYRNDVNMSGIKLSLGVGYKF